MKQEAILGVLIVCGMLILPSIPVVDADEFHPECKDKRNDSLGQWDILCGWFSEDHEQLYFTFKMHDLTPIGSSTYSVLFSCGSTKYQVNATIIAMGIPRFTLDRTDDYTERFPIKGYFDFEDNIIHIKIPKNLDDNFCQSTTIDNILATSRFHLCELFEYYSIPYSLFCDKVYGDTYTIHY